MKLTRCWAKRAPGRTMTSDWDITRVLDRLPDTHTSPGNPSWAPCFFLHLKILEFVYELLLLYSSFSLPALPRRPRTCTTGNNSETQRTTPRKAGRRRGRRICVWWATASSPCFWVSAPITSGSGSVRNTNPTTILLMLEMPNIVLNNIVLNNIGFKICWKKGGRTLVA